MITDHDTNKVYFSTRLREFAPDFVKNLEDILLSHNVKYGFIEDSYYDSDTERKYPIYNTLDIWCRDYMPIQVSEERYIHYHYFPEYLLDTKKYRATITNPIRAEHILHLDCEILNLILDGGNVIKTDSSVIMTDKVFRDNRPISEMNVERRLVKAFGVPVIFIDWNKDDKYDYLGHADGVVRYVGNNTVLISNPVFSDGTIDKYISKVRTTLSQTFNVIELPSVSGDTKSKELNWGYINYLQIGDFVLVPLFGIVDDEQIKDFFLTSVFFKDCKIAFIDCAKIAKNDGVLNCISWTVKE